jgi:hypothetical protein
MMKKPIRYKINVVRSIRENGAGLSNTVYVVMVNVCIIFYGMTPVKALLSPTQNAES